MEGNINLSFEEFMELIKLKTRVEVLKEVIENEDYVSTDLVCAILGIGVEDDGEL